MSLPEFQCKQRLNPGAQFHPIDKLGAAPIRSTDWEFALDVHGGLPPHELQVDGHVVRSGFSGDKSVWRFSLPPSVRDLTRLEAIWADGTRLVEIVHVAGDYQVPDQQLQDFYDWTECLRQIQPTEVANGTIAVEALIDQLVAVPGQGAGSVGKSRIQEPQMAKLERLLDQVLAAPIRRLIDEEVLVDAAEAQSVGAVTMEYCARHSESWDSASRLWPRPVKLLAYRPCEDYDVYENQFVFHFIRVLKTRVQKDIYECSKLCDVLQYRRRSTQAETMIGFIRQSNFTELDELIDAETQWIQRAQRFLKSLFRFEDWFVSAGVRRLSSLPAANTTLRMHPVYGTLYEMFEQLDLAQTPQKHAKVLDWSGRADLFWIFERYCLITLCAALKSCGFAVEGTRLPIPVFRADEAVPIITDGPEEAPSITLQHRIRPAVTATVSALADSLLGREGAIRLMLSHSTKEGKKTTEVWLLPNPTWWGLTEQRRGIDTTDKSAEIRNLYDRLHRMYCEIYENKAGHHRRIKRELEYQIGTLIPGSVILIHATPPTDFDNLAYKDLRLLLTYGDNFGTAKDYQAYGDYRIGSLPLFPDIAGNDERSVQRLARLIRIHLFRIGLEDLCWICFERGSLSTSDSGDKREYNCPKCHLRWGVIKCHKRTRGHRQSIECGGEMLRVNKRSDGLVHPSEEADASPRDSIVRVEAIEGRVAGGSRCESPEHADDFWALCPKCGHCEKESSPGHCWRCKERDM